MARAPQRILVIQLRRIGDVTLATPAVRVLRTNFPGAQIDFLVEPPSDQVLAGNKDISNVLVYEKNHPLKWIWKIRRRRYDWVVDFLGNPRSGAITALSGARVKAGPGNVFWTAAYSHIMPLGKTAVYSSAEKIRMLEHIGVSTAGADVLPHITVSDADSAWAEKTLDDNGTPRQPLTIAFAPASRKVTRQYPPANYAALARLIHDGLKVRPIAICGPGEQAVLDEIVALAGKEIVPLPPAPSLNKLAALLKKCDVLVCNCNGPKHIAIGVGTPTLTIHGASDPASWTPSGFPEHAFVRNESLPCIGCRRNECPTAVECLNELPPRLVYDRLLQLLKQTGHPIC